MSQEAEGSEPGAPPATGTGKPKSRRGGKRLGAGRKKKGHVAPSALAGIDLKAALDLPPPTEIESAAQRHARAALDALVKQLISGASESAKVNAANAILDRGYGKPSVEIGGESFLPFLSAPSKVVSTEIRTEARKFANLAIAVLEKIATNGQSESARVMAAKSLWDRGLGTVAPAKIPDGPMRRPAGKKEEAQAAAERAASGRYATPPPPKNAMLQ